jgi:hypothetical protein
LAIVKKFEIAGIVTIFFVKIVRMEKARKDYYENLECLVDAF